MCLACLCLIVLAWICLLFLAWLGYCSAVLIFGLLVGCGGVCVVLCWWMVGGTVVTVGCWLRWLGLCLFGLISGLGFVVWCLRSL